MTNLLRYDIKNSDIAKDLLDQGFKLCDNTGEVWTLEAPEDISSTKARKIISVCIKLYTAAKAYARSKKRYEALVDEINRLNMSR